MLAIIIFCLLLGLWVGTKVERRSNTKNITRHIEEILRGDRKGRRK